MKKIILSEAKKNRLMSYFKDIYNITKFLNLSETNDFIASLKEKLPKEYHENLGKLFEKYVDYFKDVRGNLSEMFNNPKYLDSISTEEGMGKKLNKFCEYVEKYRGNSLGKTIEYMNFKKSYTNVLGYMRYIIENPEESLAEFKYILNDPELAKELNNDLKKLKEDNKMKNGIKTFKEWKQKQNVLKETAKKILGKDDIVLEYFTKKSINKYLKENKLTIEKLTKDDYKKIQSDPELKSYMDVYGSPSESKETMKKKIDLSDELKEKIAEHGVDLELEELQMFLKHFDRMLKHRREL